MEFEDILKEVGDFGKYQKRFLLALVPAFIAAPWFCMSIVFLFATPDHWCHVTELSQSNLSLVDQKHLIRISEDISCSMSDVNYSSLLAAGDWWNESHPDWPTRSCDSGWDFDISSYDATAITKWNLVCDDTHYGNLAFTMFFIGDIIGTPLWGYVSDRWGRKPMFFFLVVITSISEIASVLSPSFVMFFLLRVINGSGTSIYRASYIIILELVSADKRTLVNGVGIIACSVGLCVLPLLAWLTRDWVYLSTVISAVAMSHLLYWKIFPESPSWLISQGKLKEAEQILFKICKSNGKAWNKQIHIQLQTLGERLETSKSSKKESPSPFDFFRHRELRRRFLLVSACWTGSFMAYSGLQFNTTNLAGSQFLNFFLLSLTELPSQLLTWYLMKRFGRRWSSVAAFMVTGAACLMPMGFLFGENPMICLMASLFGKAGSSCTYMIIYQQAPELFPTSLRSVGLGMSYTASAVFYLSVPYIIYLDRYGKYIPFLVFSLISFSSGICAALLPETLNQKLPQTVADVERIGRKKNFWNLSGKRKSKCIEISCVSSDLSSSRNICNSSVELKSVTKY